MWIISNAQTSSLLYFLRNQCPISPQTISVSAAKTIKHFQARLSSAAWFSSLWVWLIADYRVYSFILHNTSPQLLKQTSLELIRMIYRRWLLPTRLHYHRTANQWAKPDQKQLKHIIWPKLSTDNNTTKSDKTLWIQSYRSFMQRTVYSPFQSSSRPTCSKCTLYSVFRVNRLRKWLM